MSSKSDPNRTRLPSETRYRRGTGSRTHMRSKATRNTTPSNLMRRGISHANASFFENVRFNLGKAIICTQHLISCDDQWTPEVSRLRTILNCILIHHLSISKECIIARRQCSQQIISIIVCLRACYNIETPLECLCTNLYLYNLSMITFLHLFMSLAFSKNLNYIKP